MATAFGRAWPPTLDGVSLVSVFIPVGEPAFPVVAAVRSITHESIERIRRSAARGLPVYEAKIFGNAHDERAAEIRKLLVEFDRLHVVPRIVRNADIISAQVLLNILETSDEIARDIEREDDDADSAA